MARFSLEGWKFSEWLVGNKQTIQEVVKLGLPLLVFWFTTGSFWLTASGTILGKFILDLLHYYLNK